MLNVLAKTKPKTVADLEAVIETADAKIKEARAALDAHEQSIGSAAVDGADIGALNDEKRKIHDNLAALKASRDEADRRLIARRKEERAADGVRLANEQVAAFAELDGLLRRAADKRAEIAEIEQRLSEISGPRPFSIARRAWEKAQRPSADATQEEIDEWNARQRNPGSEAKERKRELARFIQDRVMTAGPDYGESIVAQIIARMEKVKK